ncbi:MAG: hypothetical protein MZV63_36230 [Marinilabiliales bacterium]|nr:hypothetical protein [Marinilabiliales bacterium]
MTTLPLAQLPALNNSGVELVVLTDSYHTELAEVARSLHLDLGRTLDRRDRLDLDEIISPACRRSPDSSADAA